MKCSICNFILCGFLVFNTLTAEAQNHPESQKKLLSAYPLTPQEIESLDQPNNHQIRRELYFSKRHRYARIDVTPLLSGSKEIQIDLFEDIPINIKINGFDQSDDGQLIRWKGTTINQEFDVESAPKELLPFIQANHEAILITFMERRRLDSEAMEKEVSIGAQPTVTVNPSDNNSSQLPPFQATYTLYARIKNPNNGKKYRVVPLENHPDFHLIYEVDDTKTLGNSENSNDPRRKSFEAHLEKIAKDTESRSEKGVAK